jgi:hypothetical protein
MVSDVSRINKTWPIDVYFVHGAGKGHGFIYYPLNDPKVIEVIKQKILLLYQQFFPEFKIAFGYDVLLHASFLTPFIISQEIQPRISFEVKGGE